MGITDAARDPDSSLQRAWPSSAQRLQQKMASNRAPADRAGQQPRSCQSTEPRAGFGWFRQPERPRLGKQSGRTSVVGDTRSVRVYTRWLGSAVLIALLLGSSYTNAADDHPLRPMNTSSPRATLQDFH